MLPKTSRIRYGMTPEGIFIPHSHYTLVVSCGLTDFLHDFMYGGNKELRILGIHLIINITDLHYLANLPP